MKFVHKFEKEFSFLGNEYLFSIEIAFEYLVTIFLFIGLIFVILMVSLL